MANSYGARKNKFEKCLFKLQWLKIPLIILIFCANILDVIKCEKFNIRDFMNERELRFYFDGVVLNDGGIPDYEVVSLNFRNRRDLSAANAAGASSAIRLRKRELNFRAFNQSIHLDLHHNELLISPQMKIVRNNFGHYDDLMLSGQTDIKRNCFYLHRSDESVGAFSNCHGEDFTGIILMANETLEVQPLTDRLKSVLSHEGYERNLDTVHFVKRVHPPNIPFGNDSRQLRSPRMMSDVKTRGSRIGESYASHRKVIVEVGVFFDEAAYNIFSPFFENDDRKLVDMILAYMNAVQAIYHHSSLGIPIDISIVHIDLMKTQPVAMPHHNGERERLLDSFCSYQKRRNPPGDDHPNHWDMAVYISGLDFYSYENGYNSGATMGLATVRGVCNPTYACVIAEFGATNAFHRPYPSAGFTSVYILAHEMGHNLGMSHDSSGNYCSKEGYIMSPSRGTQGETSWSSCSAQVARELPTWATCLRDPPEYVSEEYNAMKFHEYPGQVWPAKRQCELLLQDKDATDSPTNGAYSICQNLECRSPHRTGYFFAGPALQGTTCGRNMWCEGGYCTPKQEVEKPPETVIGGWGPWTTGKCASACIQKSKGFEMRRRECNNPKPVNTNEGCEGSSYDVELCDDSRICSNIKRFSPITYASDRCRAFSHRLSTLDPRGYGLQAPHETNRLWMACAIFCRRADSLSYYTPRLELNELGLDAYFPDGTWCHSDTTSNYYCQQHHCLPEGFHFGKFNVWALSDDVPVSSNAKPDPFEPINGKIQDYLSLDRFGRPLRTALGPEDFDEIMKNEVWTDDMDYKSVPRYMEQEYLVD